MRLRLQTRVEAAAAIARSGLLRPIRPDRFVRQGYELWRWDSTLAGAYVVHATGTPDQPALADEQGELTYDEINARTNALARGMSELGVREADRVAVLARNGRGFVEPVVAVSKLGADVLLLNTSFSAQELGAVMRREHPTLLVHDAEFADMIEKAEIEGVGERLVAHFDGARPPVPTADELIERCDRDGLSPPEREGRSIILTSGTTGIPKGARVARPENMDPLAWLLRRVPIRARTPSVIAAPLFHAHGFGQLAAGSGLACKLVLERRFDPERTLALIAEHAATTLVAVPVMLKRMVELPKETRKRYDVSSLRVALCSGSALSGDLARSFMDAFGPVVYNLYGSTEVAWATIATPDDLLAAPGTVGRPPPHTRIAILDDAGCPLPPGETGRIFVGHEMLFEGYTDASVPLPRSGDMMTPGDLGHLDEEGRLFVDARADDMIVSGGENVYPGEVEAALQEHPDIDQIAAVGVEDEEFGQRLVAYVVPRPGSRLTEDAIVKYAKANVARFKVPREVKLRDELPRNALGKVLKRELR